MSIKQVQPLQQVQQRYAVNRAGMHEGLYQPVYDQQTYPAAGSSLLTFFQLPQGQSSKTLEDTNMEAAGQFPSPKHFLCTGLEVFFYSGLAPGRGAGAAATAGQIWTDVHAIAKRGFLRLFVGSKDYLVDGPLNVFPPSFRLSGAAAIAAHGDAAATVDQIDYAVFAGKPYDISPVFIPATQNFKVTLEFPNGAVALPSANATSKIGVRMLGFQYRLSQ